MNPILSIYSRQSAIACLDRYILVNEKLIYAQLLHQLFYGIFVLSYYNSYFLTLMLMFEVELMSADFRGIVSPSFQIGLKIVITDSQHYLAI